ncbi:MAG: UxaA family hydrolase [Oscillospiraceae bacterium]|nr:UxaA family hydrolase [Oscillospiraceae bacterium]
MFKFLGYERQDGSVGIRNHVVVIPTVACVNGVVHSIASKVPGIIPLYHSHGCGRLGEDLKIHARTLVNICKNSNVAAVLAIGLGCEFIKIKEFSEAVAESGKPVESFNVQTDGGSVKVVEKGIEAAQRLLDAASKVRRVEAGLDKIVLGLECGGSDALSGVTANPAIGKVTDWLVQNGGTAILTEVTEMIGTAHILKKRAATPELGEAVAEIVNAQERKTQEVLGEKLAGAIISPGNMDGGMSTIREKSLGCICKAGTSPISELVSYGAIPKGKGLIVMDGPGYDVDSIAGEAASGANLIIFSTGRGNPLGFPIVPIIKIASNTKLYDAMPDDMDVNAGRMLEGVTLQQMGDEIIELTKQVIQGKQSKAEINNHDSCLGLLCTTTAF